MGNLHLVAADFIKEGKVARGRLMGDKGECMRSNQAGCSARANAITSLRLFLALKEARLK